MIELWTLPLPNPAIMGSRTLKDLQVAANQAKARGAFIVGYTNQHGECGFRVYDHLSNNWGVSGPMNDCGEGWGVQLIGRYRSGRWCPMRTTSTQTLLERDPLS